MAKTDLINELGILGSLHDVFNRIARECDSRQAAPFLIQMAERFDQLAYRALTGTFGRVAGREQSLQDALDTVFEPMTRLYDLGQDNPSLRPIWQEAVSAIGSFEEPVVAALQKCQRAAPDKPIPLLQPIKFRFRAQQAYA